MNWPQDAEHTPVVSGKGRSDWRHESEYFVYIGLPGYGDGLPKTGEPTWDGAPFGKPWRIVQGADDWKPRYWDYLVERIQNEPVFAGAVASLHGKTLVCWCKGKPKSDGESATQSKFCHGDLLAAAAERLYHALPEYER
jgi:hypothetical protein